MPITFNADEIFEMAEEIERTASKLYSEAADHAADEDTKHMFTALASMESRHWDTFAKMREELTDSEKAQNVFDPENEASLYLQAMADAHGSEGKLSPTQELTGRESMREILEIAINAEKDSIIFYTGIKGFISAKAGKDRITAIIAEEVDHLAQLKQKLAAMRW